MKEIRRIIFFLLLLSIPIVNWLMPIPGIIQLCFLVLALAVLITQYSQPAKFLHEAVEFIFLFFCLSQIIEHLELEKFFPAGNVVILTALLLFLLILKGKKRPELFLIRGDSRGMLAYVVVFSALSIAALAGWFLNLNGNPYAKFLPAVDLPMLLLLGLGFALFNAVYEEIIFRGMLLSIFSIQLGLAAAIVLQACWFGCLHFRSGFPSGYLGMGLTFIFGSMMGYLTFRTRGIVIPVITHF